MTYIRLLIILSLLGIICWLLFWNAPESFWYRLGGIQPVVILNK
jgi:hypothetical protein